MKRIYITGCARSGTTLLNRLFHAFDDTEVISPEIGIDEFCAFPAQMSTLLGKRTPLTILSVPLPKIELDRQLRLVHRYDIRIVNIIRDGRDVVHQNPTGPRVNVNRWIGCILQAQRYHKEVVLQIRYEDLIRNPDAVQNQLARILKLHPIANFSEYPSFVPASVFDETEYREFPYYRKRPIDCASIGHSSTEYLSLCTSNEEREMFERILVRMGYAMGKNVETWPTEVLAKEETIFANISRMQGYCCD